jgi:hypothetical protein
VLVLDSISLASQEYALLTVTSGGELAILEALEHYQGKVLDGHGNGSIVPEEEEAMSQCQYAVNTIKSMTIQLQEELLRRKGFGILTQEDLKLPAEERARREKTKLLVLHDFLRQPDRYALLDTPEEAKEVKRVDVKKKKLEEHPAEMIRRLMLKEMPTIKVMSFDMGISFTKNGKWKKKKDLVEDIVAKVIADNKAANAAEDRKLRHMDTGDVPPPPDDGGYELPPPPPPGDDFGDLPPPPPMDGVDSADLPPPPPMDDGDEGGMPPPPPGGESARLLHDVLSKQVPTERAGQKKGGITKFMGLLSMAKVQYSMQHTAHITQMQHTACLIDTPC